MPQLKEFFYLANIIDYVRLALLYFAYFSSGYMFCAYYVGSYALDAIDGMVARAMGQESRLGYYLDMVTDRISSVLCLYLAARAVSAGTTFVPAEFHDVSVAVLYGCAVAVEVVSHGVVVFMSEVLNVHQKKMGLDFKIVQLYLGNKWILLWACASFELLGLGLIVNEPIAVAVGLPGFVFRALANVVRLWAAFGYLLSGEKEKSQRAE
eukprot:Hpha_TRINITY_DN13318_c0_g5::TRINITY_DN13318_c0_g5_i1::g.95210::m.95210/K00999/CDIPT; CDP-diacylglycerol--inositol 3-phosphatidyltransferase